MDSDGEPNIDYPWEQEQRNVYIYYYILRYCTSVSVDESNPYALDQGRQLWRILGRSYMLDAMSLELCMPTFMRTEIVKHVVSSCIDRLPSAVPGKCLRCTQIDLEVLQQYRKTSSMIQTWLPVS